MFRRLNLSKDGATAKAVVIEARAEGGMPGRAGGYSATQYDLKLHVHFDDGSDGDATCRVGGFIRGTDLSFSEGDIVPVRYDPDDRSKVEVDVPALSAERDKESQSLRDEAVARAEDKLDGIETPEPRIFGSAAEDRRQRKEQARAGRERQKARRAAQLEKLTRKHDQGLIGDEEFAAKKENLERDR
jgi:hypothetical protein